MKKKSDKSETRPSKNKRLLKSTTGMILNKFVEGLN